MSVRWWACVHVHLGLEKSNPSTLPAHLNVLGQAFQGVNIQAFLARLQAGDNFLGFDAAGSDS